MQQFVKLMTLDIAFKSLIVYKHHFNRWENNIAN